MATIHRLDTREGRGPWLKKARPNSSGRPYTMFPAKEIAQCVIIYWCDGRGEPRYGHGPLISLVAVSRQGDSILILSGGFTNPSAYRLL